MRCLPETRALIREVAARYAVDPEQVISRSTDRRLYPPRHEIVKALQARGYGVSRIARVMGRDRHSIRYWLGLKNGSKPKWSN